MVRVISHRFRVLLTFSSSLLIVVGVNDHLIDNYLYILNHTLMSFCRDLNLYSTPWIDHSLICQSMEWNMNLNPDSNSHVQWSFPQIRGSRDLVGFLFNDFFLLVKPKQFFSRAATPTELEPFGKNEFIMYRTVSSFVVTAMQCYMYFNVASMEWNINLNSDANSHVISVFVPHPPALPLGRHHSY